MESYYLTKTNKLIKKRHIDVATRFFECGSIYDVANKLGYSYNGVRTIMVSVFKKILNKDIPHKNKWFDSKEELLSEILLLQYQGKQKKG